MKGNIVLIDYISPEAIENIKKSCVLILSAEQVKLKFLNKSQALQDPWIVNTSTAEKIDRPLAIVFIEISQTKMMNFIKSEIVNM